MAISGGGSSRPSAAECGWVAGHLDTFHLSGVRRLTNSDEFYFAFQVSLLQFLHTNQSYFFTKKSSRYQRFSLGLASKGCAAALVKRVAVCCGLRHCSWRLAWLWRLPKRTPPQPLPKVPQSHALSPRIVNKARAAAGGTMSSAQRRRLVSATIHVPRPSPRLPKLRPLYLRLLVGRCTTSWPSSLTTGVLLRPSLPVRSNASLMKVC